MSSLRPRTGRGSSKLGLRNTPNAPPELVSGSAPKSASRFVMSGAWTAFVSDAIMRSRMGRGVFAGATSPSQADAANLAGRRDHREVVCARTAVAGPEMHLPADLARAMCRNLSAAGL